MISHAHHGILLRRGSTRGKPLWFIAIKLVMLAFLLAALVTTEWMRIADIREKHRLQKSGNICVTWDLSSSRLKVIEAHRAIVSHYFYDGSDHKIVHCEGSMGQMSDLYGVYQ